MNVEAFLQDQEWDAPFFKVLASNDTGESIGNQAGIVIPIGLRQYFPELNPAQITPESPTVDNRVWAELWSAGRLLDTVSTRYQFQTWGGTRTPESRLTDNLSQLRNLARGGDILVFQRHSLDLERYRLCLVRQSEGHDYQILSNASKGSRWGALDDTPVTDDMLTEALLEREASEAKAFGIFDPHANFVEIRAKRLARTIAFRKKLIELYDGNCAVCRGALRTPRGRSEVEGAHVVPRNLGGVNDARNGLALCRQHHWAFDRGLFGIDPKRMIFVPEAALRVPGNEPLRHFHGKALNEANDSALKAHEEALNWHFTNTMVDPT